MPRRRPIHPYSKSARLALPHVLREQLSICASRPPTAHAGCRRKTSRRRPGRAGEIRRTGTSTIVDHNQRRTISRLHRRMARPIRIDQNVAGECPNTFLNVAARDDAATRRTARAPMPNRLAGLPACPRAPPCARELLRMTEGRSDSGAERHKGHRHAWFDGRGFSGVTFAGGSCRTVGKLAPVSARTGAIRHGKASSNFSRDLSRLDEILGKSDNACRPECFPYGDHRWQALHRRLTTSFPPSLKKNKP